MSPVFGHGRLRLYLLKLLEESPRHGYEVIRLLQDRFLGVYSPSPGTIYPRLARLEEEGLVTHEVRDGKKVFTLTDLGRAELNDRMDELADLELEITASVQDIAREVKEDVRQTVRSLRQELTQMAKTINADTRAEAVQARDTARAQREDWNRRQHEQREQWHQYRDEWRRQKQSWQEDAERWKSEWQRIWTDTWALTGMPLDKPAHAANDARLGQSLADFVGAIRTHAAVAQLTDDDVADVERLLTETQNRIRTILNER